MYNCYVWNDPTNLLDWFVDDKNKHYGSQLPILPKPVAKMKAKYLHLATTPVS